MAGDVFELLVSYPDGHIEIIEETFYTLEKANEYGEGMLNQIYTTEQFHHGKSDESLTPRRLRKPYYEIYRIVDGDRLLVQKVSCKKIK